MPFVLIIRVQARPEPARFNANDRVDLGVEPGGPTQHLDADDGFLDLGCTAVQCAFDNEGQHALGALGFSECVAREDALELDPYEVRVDIGRLLGCSVVHGCSPIVMRTLRYITVGAAIVVIWDPLPAK